MLPVKQYNINYHYNIDVPYWEHYFVLPNKSIGELQKAYSTLRTDYIPDSIWNKYIRKIRYFYNFFIGNNGIMIAWLDRENNNQIQTQMVLYNDINFCKILHTNSMLTRYRYEVLPYYYRRLFDRIKNGYSTTLYISSYHIEISKKGIKIYNKKGKLLLDYLDTIDYNTSSNKLIFNRYLKNRVVLNDIRHKEIVEFFKKYKTLFFKEIEINQKHKISVLWKLTRAIVIFISNYIFLFTIFGIVTFIFGYIFKLKLTAITGLAIVVITLVLWKAVVDFMSDRWG